VNNGIVQPTVLQQVDLDPGDSVRVVISVLEAESGDLAPINSIADYVINGDVAEVIPKLIKYYKANAR